MDESMLVGIIILVAIVGLLVIWLYGRKEPQEYPEKRRWRYE
jgi:hypothetical protein